MSLTESQIEMLDAKWLHRYGKCLSLSEIVAASCNSSYKAPVGIVTERMKRFEIKERDEQYIRGYCCEKSNDWLCEQLCHVPRYVVIKLARKWRKINASR